MTVQAVPSLGFDTAGFESEDRMDAVADLWRNYLVFNIDQQTKKSFFLRSNIWWLNDCVFVNSVAAAMQCHRPPPPDDESLISVSYLRHGAQDYLHDGTSHKQCPGAVHVSRHGDQTFRDCYTDSDIFIFYLPAIRIGLVPGQAFPVRTFPTTTPVGAILRSALLSLPQALGDCTQEEAATLADSICAMLQPMLRHSPDTTSDAVALCKRHAIQHYIEDNIRDRSLDTGKICRDFAVSRPTLYRLFRESGGVMTYVKRRRMHHVFSELSRSSPRWGVVKSVAEKFGFDDMTQFTRTFRRHTGTTPGDVVGLARPDTPAGLTANLGSRTTQFHKPLLFSRAHCSG